MNINIKNAEISCTNLECLEGELRAHPETPVGTGMGEDLHLCEPLVITVLP